MRWHVYVMVITAMAGCRGPTSPTGGANDPDAAPIAPAFARADQDGDRVLSAAEWTTESAIEFDRLDRNHDQVVDAVELRGSFEILDLDGDGAIEREEAGELVERGDADGDGRLSRAEFEQLDWESLNADLNRDGRISREEFYFARDQLFLAADGNRDRRLSHREIDPVRFPLLRFRRLRVPDPITGRGGPDRAAAGHPAPSVRNLG